MKNDYEDDEEQEVAVRPSQSKEETDRIVSTTEVEVGSRRELVELFGDSESEGEQEHGEKNSSECSGGEGQDKAGLITQRDALSS